MCIYIIISIIILLLGIILKPYKFNDKNNNNNKIFLVVSFLLLFITSAIRSKNIGVDTLQYYNAFSRIANITIDGFAKIRYEYGFTFMCLILSKIINNPQSLLFFTSLIINYTIIKFIYNNSDNTVASVLIYIFLNFYFSYMNIMRQALAICIVLWGFEYLKKGKSIRFILFCILASMFHESAILAVLLLVAKKIKFTRKTLLITLLLMILSFLYGNQFFIYLSKYSPRLLYYVNSKYNVSNYFGALLDAFVYIVLYIFGIIVISKNDKVAFIDKNSNTNYLIGTLGIACIFQTLVMKVSIFNRFSPYFLIFIILWIPNVLSKVKINKNRGFYYIIIFFFLILYWSIIMIYRPEWYGVIPYETFF